MTVITLGIEDVQSKSQNAGRILLENMYLVDSPFSPDGISRVSRPTLTNYLTVGSGPILGMFHQQGSLDSYTFIVSGNELYKSRSTEDATFVGLIPGTGYCKFAAGSDRLLILRDGACYSTDGTSVSSVTMPDKEDVGSIAYIDSFFFLSVKDSQKFYWIQPGQTFPDPLDFASAERFPDNIVSINIVADEIWIIGNSSIEVWVASNDPDAPFQRVSGRSYSYGAATNDTMVSMTYNGFPCLIWVTDKLTVAMAQGSPTRISNDSVDEILRSSSDFRAWGFEFNRHSFYILTCKDGTFAFDLAKQTWSRWSSYNEVYWRAHLGIQDDSTCFAGDSKTNQVWKLEDGESDGDDPIIRSVSGIVISPASYLPCTRVNVMMNAGWTGMYGPSAVLELRWSDDLGLTWTDYFPAKIGELGQYGTTVSYTGLGTIVRPGRMFQFRFSDKARFRLDYATMNEA